MEYGIACLYHPLYSISALLGPGMAYDERSESSWASSPKDQAPAQLDSLRSSKPRDEHTEGLPACVMAPRPLCAHPGASPPAPEVDRPPPPEVGRQMGLSAGLTGGAPGAWVLRALCPEEAPPEKP